MREYFRTKLGVLYLGNALDLLKSLPTQSVDLVLTDPPYGVTDLAWDDYTDIKFWKFTEEWLWEIKRVLKIGGQAYIFFAQKKMFEFKEVLDKVGLPFKRLLIWHHPNKGMLTSKQYLWMYDPIFYCVKGKRPRVFHSSFLQKHNVDVFTFPIPQTNFVEDKKYGWCQKPLKLCQILIMNSTDPMDLVLDPFSGTGTTLLASETLGRRWIGIDIREEVCEIAKDRLSRFSKNKRLFRGGEGMREVKLKGRHFYVREDGELLICANCPYIGTSKCRVAGKGPKDKMCYRGREIIHKWLEENEVYILGDITSLKLTDEKKKTVRILRSGNDK